MPPLPPPIDPRSYDDIVAQVAMLAEYFTQGFTSEVEPTIATLLGRTLNQEIRDGTGAIATPGSVVSLALARQISQLEGLNRVKVTGGWYAPGTSQVRPTIAALSGRILSQDLVDPVTQELIATHGTPINASLAERISRTPDLTWVKVRANPGTIEVEPTVEALMGQVLDQEIPNPAKPDQPLAVRGRLIDLNLAEQIERVSQVQGFNRVRVKVMPDAGWAMIRIFSHLAMLVRDRLNRVPDKNFLAFLDLIGTQILPPQPARVPLTFYLAEGSIEDGLVPAQTSIAAPPSEGAAEEVVFETERDLLVTTAQLQAVFVHQPETVSYSDRTPLATGQVEGAFPAFKADQAIEYSLYLACDPLFTLPGVKTATLKIDSPQAAELAGLPITWSFWNGKSWQAIEEAVPQHVNTQWLVTLSNLPPLAPHLLDGQEAGWIRAQLTTPRSSQSPRLHCEQISVSATLTSTNLNPDRCFYNTTPIDLSKDFYPFGEQPRFNDTFYMASWDAFSKGGNQVLVEVDLSDGRPVKKDGGIEVVWEAWDGQTWQVALANSPGESAANFTKDKPATNPTTGKPANTFALTLPPVTKPHTINGETNYWVRARIVKGDYGKPAFSEFVKNDSEGRPIYKLVEASFQPPSLVSLKLNYTHTSEDVPVSLVRVYDRLTYLDPFATDRTTTLIQERKAGEKTLKVARIAGLMVGDRLRIDSGSNQEAHEIVRIDPSNNVVTLKNPLTKAHALHTPAVRDFQPFMPVEDTRPTLYLGFDHPFANRAIALYIQVEPPLPGDVAGNPRPAIPARVIWEYTTPTGWMPLSVKDETEAFSDRGLMRFIAPANLAARTEFGQPLYWLRCRHEEGAFRVPPHLRRILTNTIWASQTITLTNEILGSSNGNPDQTFRTLRVPVLPGQQLQVQETQVPSPAEQALLEKLEGLDAITVLEDEVGQVEAVWVRWHAVPDFYGSRARDRHYVLDPLTGTVRFGDGQRGMIPPQGRNNLRMAHYRTGGGLQGNQPAQTVTQLKTTLPSIDRVTNLEAAGGGANQESLERIRERGPRMLRHRNRAVTAQDMEDLAFDASTDVVRARAITPDFDPIGGLQWLPSYPFRLDKPGEIRITMDLGSRPPRDLALEVRIYGPGQATPYARQTFPPTREPLVYAVTPEQFALGAEWNVTIVNSGDSNVQQGRITINFPDGSRSEELEVPASKANQDIQAAGRVELIIVPNSTAAQPTPSLSLINQVENFIRDRCISTLDLFVTEPDWVEVTVRATLVPRSLDVADAAKTAALQALTRFLHPLMGGPTGQGWSFGRRPHTSDLYAVLEAIAEIDHVTTLTISSIPGLGDDPTVTPLPSDRLNRFLIYSGEHEVDLL